jgi:hypothetical protein
MPITMATMARNLGNLSGSSLLLCLIGVISSHGIVPPTHNLHMYAALLIYLQHASAVKVSKPALLYIILLHCRECTVVRCRYSHD